MGSFNRDGDRSGGGFGRGSSFGGNKSFGAKRFGDRGGDRGSRGGDFQKTMHRAVCDECGDNCEVPFKPSGDKPVLCSHCFGKSGGPAPRFGGDRGERRERPSFEDRQMHDAICDKCGSECQVPFRPTPGKEIFCNNCFVRKDDTRGGSRETKDSGELLEKINQLNYKVDKLMKLLGYSDVKEESKEKKETKEKTSKETKTEEIKEEKPKKEIKEKTTKTKVAKKKETTKKKK
ncbi:MAG: CxxC-x17-CxxC domain-containing protein [Candidatus Magasanikbacteria bacterium]